jgi:hypothetical protein
MTTVVVLLLLMALTVLGLGGMVVSTLEGQIAANQFHSKQATFAAEAGADGAILWLQANLRTTDQLEDFALKYPVSGTYGTAEDPKFTIFRGMRVYRYAGEQTTYLVDDDSIPGTPSVPMRYPDITTGADSARQANFVAALPANKTLDGNQGLSYTAAVELVDQEPMTWRVVSIGRKTAGGTVGGAITGGMPVATQAVAYIVRKNAPNVNPPGALSVGGQLKVGGNASISSELAGKFGAVAEDTITINGGGTISQAGPDGILGTADDVVANKDTGPCDPCDATDQNIGNGNLPHFWEIFFEQEFNKPQYSSLTDAAKDVLALDMYREMAKEISQKTIGKLDQLDLSSPDQVPTDGTGGTKGYKGLYFINMGGGTHTNASYTGQPGPPPTGNALVTGNTSDNDPNNDDAAVLVIVSSASDRSADILDPSQSYVKVNVNGANFTGFIYVVGEYDMQGNSTINGAVISTGDQQVDILGTGGGSSKISYTKRAAKKLADAIPYTKRKGSWAEAGLLK